MHSHPAFLLCLGFLAHFRCEIDGVQEKEGQPETLAIKALHEYTPFSTSDWRSKLDNQRGAVLATQYKSNGAKLARWTAAALLSNVDIMKIG